MSRERTPKEVVISLWTKIFNEHDVEYADEIVAEDYRQHTEGVPGGRDGFKTTFRRYLEMSPDLRVEMKSIVEIDDLVVVRGNVFMSQPPPGYTSPIEVVDIFRVREGKLQEHWEA